MKMGVFEYLERWRNSNTPYWQTEGLSREDVDEILALRAEVERLTREKSEETAAKTIGDCRRASEALGGKDAADESN